MSRAEPRVPRRTGAWVVPVAAVALGVFFLVIGLVRGEVLTGVLELVVMTVFGAGLLLWSPRSESVALLAGDTSDERRAQIQLRASSLTGAVLSVTVVAGLLWSLATNSADTGVFTTLSVITGITVVCATVWCSRHG